jgi:hypothetical protein
LIGGLQTHRFPDLLAPTIRAPGHDLAGRKGRSGAFWEGRYHATMVDSGEYLWECVIYVELNMVRCGVVDHPRQWNWSGYES